MKVMHSKFKNLGFTLTETLVAVLVLTMAIVTATNFIVSMIKSNVMNSNTLQAYYYTQEGIEAFRNMRDTNFMNNVDFCGNKTELNNFVSFFGEEKEGFCNEKEYGLSVVLSPNRNVNKDTFSSASPWILTTSPEKIKFNDVGTIFMRTCKADNYKDSTGKDLAGAKEIVCTTTWDENGSKRELKLSMILTNWKDE